MNESSPSPLALEFEVLFEDFVGRIARREFHHPHVGGLFHETIGPLQELFILFWSLNRVLTNPPVAPRARGRFWQFIFGEALPAPTPDQGDAAARFNRCWLAMAGNFGWFKCAELEDICLRVAETWNSVLRTEELGAWLQSAERFIRIAQEGLNAVRAAAWHSGPIGETDG